VQNDGDIAGVKEGDVLAGKYRIDKVLGVGGMGVVVAAHHIHLDDRVAIKFMLPHALTNGDAVSRFAREARAAVKIKSEHVARVSDVGTLENGAPYMVMEYLEGRDLAAWLEQSGALPIDQAVEFVLQAAEALAEAHTLGIVHRDLKPANLFVIRTPDGQLSVKVLDFGISKLTKIPGNTPKSDMDLTKTSAMMGSPLYMSPEQMQSAKEVDARADIWALGVILYELLCGTVPFLSESLPEVLIKIISAEPDPPRSKRPDVPPELERVIFRCLAKDRNKRYPTVAELAGELMPFAPKRSKVSFERISGIMQGAGLSDSWSVGFAPSTVPAITAGGRTQAAWGHTAEVGSNHKLAAILGVVLVALIVIGVGAYLLRTGVSAPVEPAALNPTGPPTLPRSPDSKPSAAAAPLVPASSPPGPTRGPTTEPGIEVAAPSPKLRGSTQPKPSVQVRSSPKLPQRAPIAAQTVPPAAAAPTAKKPSVFDDR